MTVAVMVCRYSMKDLLEGRHGTDVDFRTVHESADGDQHYRSGKNAERERNTPRSPRAVEGPAGPPTKNRHRSGNGECERYVDLSQDRIEGGQRNNGTSDPRHREPECGEAEPLRHASMPSTTSPCTSVSRNARPWKRNVSRVWSMPRR